MKVKARAALELMRPANIITAFADILAGFAAAGGVLALTSSGFDLEPDGVGWLLLATFGLYGGGIVFNDVFDASIDAEERPERAIPSGRISGLEASEIGRASCRGRAGISGEGRVGTRGRTRRSWGRVR